jgi:hypothetical protein
MRIVPNYKALPEMGAWAQNPGFLDALGTLQDRLYIKSVLPDLCGKRPLYPLSAIHIVPK